MSNSCKCSLKIMSLLRGIQGALKCNMASSAENFDLTSSQFMIMYEIYNHKDISLNELSTRLDIPKSSVSRIVDQLVNKGVVNREIPKENRRTVKLSIASKFLENKELNNDIIGDLEPEKSERIIEALEELKSVLDYEKNK